MRILLVHNRYRSGTPSGENRVVDQEGEALAALGHEVMRFGRSSDEINQWSLARKASLPVRTIWSREAYRDLKAVLREHHPEVVHVHNTFPLISDAVLYACRDARVPVVATMHNYRLACSNGSFFRSGTVCHDCTHGLPVRAVVHGCYRGSHAATVPVALARGLHRQAWRSLVSAYIFISASQRDLHRTVGLAHDREFVRYNLIPRQSRPRMERTPSVVYAGRLHEVKGLRLLMAGWDRYRRESGKPGLNLVVAGGGPLEDEVAAWASTRPSVEMTGTVSRRPVRRTYLACTCDPAASRLGGTVRSRCRRGHGCGRPPHCGGPRVVHRTRHLRSRWHTLQSWRSGRAGARHCRCREEPRAIRGLR